MVRKCGVGVELAKGVVKSVFNILLVHPLDFNLVGFKLGRFILPISGFNYGLLTVMEMTCLDCRVGCRSWTFW